MPPSLGSWTSQLGLENQNAACRTFFPLSSLPTQPTIRQSTLEPLIPNQDPFLTPSHPRDSLTTPFPINILPSLSSFSLVHNTPYLMLLNWSQPLPPSLCLPITHDPYPLLLPQPQGHICSHSSGALPLLSNSTNPPESVFLCPHFAYHQSLSSIYQSTLSNSHQLRQLYMARQLHLSLDSNKPFKILPSLL